MKKTCALLIGLAVVSGVLPADAAKKAKALEQVQDLRWRSQPEYAIAGIACVASSQTLEGNLHVTQAGNVRFAEGKAGTLTMFCPITYEPLLYIPNNSRGIEVLLLDGDGRQDSSTVSVNLRRVERSSGSISDHPGAQLNSNRDCTENWTGFQACSVGFQELFQFDKFYYFFQVTLERSSAGPNVSLGGIRLLGPLVD